MSKIPITSTEASEITAVYSEDGEITHAIIQEGDNDPVSKEVICNPEMITEMEARLSFTSDSLPDVPVDDED